MPKQTSINFLDKQMAVLTERFDNLEKKIDDILNILSCLPDKYVTNERFKPYALALNMVGGAVLIAVIGGLIKLILVETD